MRSFSLISLVLSLSAGYGQTIVINEVQSSNLRGYADEYDEADGWFEL